MVRQLANRSRLILASEANPGVDAVNALLTNAAADIIYQDVRSSTVDLKHLAVAQSRERNSAAGVAHAVVKDRAEVKVSFPFTGREGAGDGEEAPFYSPILKASGFVENLTGANAVYSLSTLPQPAMTAWKYIRETDGQHRLKRALGVRGNLSLNFATNQELLGEFSGTGIFPADAEYFSDAAQYFDATAHTLALLADGVTSVPARTGGALERYARKSKMIVRGMVVRINGTAWMVRGMTWATNWTVDAIDAGTGASTIQDVQLTRGDDQRAGGSFDLADSTRSHVTEFARLLRTAEEFALDVTVTQGDGSTGSETITFDFPTSQVGIPSIATVGNFVQYGVPFMNNGDHSDLVADDDAAFTYGAVA